MRLAFTRFVPVAPAFLARHLSTRSYTDSHEWVSYCNDEATIGVTQYAQENLGDVVYVSLPQVGSSITAREVLAEVESVKATSNVYSPVDGVVSAVNDALKDDPGCINRSPEEEGWIVKMKCSELPKGLMTLDEYKKFLE